MKTTISIVVIMLIPVLGIAGNSEPPAAESANVEEVIYEKMELESWMMDLSGWAAKVESISPSAVDQVAKPFGVWNQEAAEEDLHLESWMMRPASGSWNSMEEEQMMRVEEWMFTPSEWLRSE